MAVTYTGTNGVFTHIGKVVKAVNDCETQLANWDTLRSAVQTVYDAGGQQVAEAPLITTVTQVQSSIASTRASLAGMTALRLQDFTSVVQVLGISSNQINAILYALINQMVTDTATIDASTVTLGSVTAAGTNIGNGTIIIDSTLDGYNAPCSGAQPHPHYAGLLSEFSVSETMTVTCTQDSYADGLTSGKESFKWNGELPLSSQWVYGDEGSGDGPTVNTLQSGTILSNMGFESFGTTDTPDSWTAVAGVIGTNIKQETGGSNVYRGSSSLKIAGNGVAAAITLRQAIPISSVKPLQRLACSFRYKASAAEGVAGKTFLVSLTGTGYTAGSTEKVSILGASLATSWTLRTFFVNIPANPPSDLSLTITFTGTPTVSIYLDDVGFDKVPYHNGICCAAIAGSTPFAKNDKFTFTVSNDQASTFQEFFRRQYLVNLPSNLVGSESISDSLCT